MHFDNIPQDYYVQFKKKEWWENRLLKKFDYNSVMLYGPLTFSKDGKSITMTPKQNNVTMIEVFQKYGLSNEDINAVQKLYQCD